MASTGKKDLRTGDSLGTGRRKTAVARVRLRAGSGKIMINNREFENYFPVEGDRGLILDVLRAAGKLGQVDLAIRCSGGGVTGQAAAARMGIARALVGLDEATFPAMRGQGYLTRDSRMKERKKYGLRGARRGVQFSKR
jgi:small subunit ribosomal protein S9